MLVLNTISTLSLQVIFLVTTKLSVDASNVCSTPKKCTCDPPSCARLGGIFPMFLQPNTTANPTKDYVPDHVGIQYLRAYKMAVDDINDGMYKQYYPNVSLIYSVQGTTIPFIDDVVVSLYQNTKVFDGRPIHAMLASANNNAANAAAQINNGKVYLRKT